MKTMILLLAVIAFTAVALAGCSTGTSGALGVTSPGALGVEVGDPSEGPCCEGSGCNQPDECCPEDCRQCCPDGCDDCPDCPEHCADAGAANGAACSPAGCDAKTSCGAAASG
jgi:hypothetical protein